MTGQSARLVLVGYFLAVWCSGCDGNLSNYTPTNQAILNPKAAVHPFIVSHESVTGIFGNSDVECLMFSYETAFKDKTRFWSALDEQLESSAFRRTDGNSDEAVRKYEQSLSDDDTSQVRIGVRGDGTIVVAWIVINSDAKENFATHTFWPKFEEALEEHQN